MTEYEKAQEGYLYDANYDEELAVKRSEEITSSRSHFTAIMERI